MNIRNIFTEKIKYLPMVKRITLKRAINFILFFLESRFNTKHCFSLPIHLDIVPTKRCNFNCIFCIKYTTKNINDLTPEQFRQYAKKLLPSALTVRFCSGGEPLLNKNIREILKICKEYNVSTRLTTNATFLDKEMSEFILRETAVDVINISLDGALKQTVESIRRNANFDKIIQNIKSFADIKKQLKTKLPLLIIRFAVMKKNIHELPLLIKLAKEIGIDAVHVNFLNVTNDIKDEESLYYHPDLLAKYFSLAKQEAGEDIVLRLPQLITKEIKAKKCYMPWEFVMIDVDGSLKFCYESLESSLANFSDDQNFRKIWNNDKFKSLRSSVNKSSTYFNYCSICKNKKGFNELSAHKKATNNDDYFYSFNNNLLNT